MSDLSSRPPALHPHRAAVVAPVHAAAASPPSPRKPKDKLRSAWISFAGRIVAQLIGAAATVLLGVYVVSGYSAHGRQGNGDARAATTVGTPAGTPAGPDAAPRPAAARHPRGAGALVVLPLLDFSPDGRGSDRTADALTDGLTATLARRRAVPVVSRTSAMHYKGSDAALPAIAAALDVAFVVEGSIVRQGTRLRVTVQLIDATSDTHLWARTYDRPAGDLLAVEAELSDLASADILAALPPASSSATYGRAGAVAQLESATPGLTTPIVAGRAAGPSIQR